LAVTVTIRQLFQNVLFFFLKHFVMTCCDVVLIDC